MQMNVKCKHITNKMSSELMELSHFFQENCMNKVSSKTSGTSISFSKRERLSYDPLVPLELLIFMMSDDTIKKII